MQREQRSSFCLLMWCILRGEGQGEENILSSPLSFPEAVGDFLFLPISTLTKNTDIHTTCQSYNLPVWSINYEVFQRNTWIKQTVCHPILALAVDCEFTMLYCHSFWYFITCIHFSLFWVWCVGSVLTLQIYSKSKTPPLIDISVKA